MAGNKPSHNSAFMKGMNKDISKPMLEANQYRHAENLRITNIDGEGNGALVNIKGNEYAINIPNVNGVVQAWAPGSIPNVNIYILVVAEGTTYRNNVSIPAGTLDITDRASFNRSLVKIIGDLATNVGGKTFKEHGFRFYTADSGKKIEVHDFENSYSISDVYFSETTAASGAFSTQKTMQDSDTPVKIVTNSPFVGSGRLAIQMNQTVVFSTLAFILIIFHRLCPS